jgi:hypothetical protein
MMAYLEIEDDDDDFANYEKHTSQVLYILREWHGSSFVSSDDSSLCSHCIMHRVTESKFVA